MTMSPNAENNQEDTFLAGDVKSVGFDDKWEYTK